MKTRTRMKAIFANMTSGSGDVHEWLIAAFTTQEKAEIFLEKLKNKYPKEDWSILDYEFPKVDPENLDEVIDENTRNET